jgi:hypothetical protein
MVKFSLGEAFLGHSQTERGWSNEKTHLVNVNDKA